VRGPLAEGLKTRLIVQLAPAATPVPQLLLWLKSPLLVPVMDVPVITSAVVPGFFSVTVCATLAELTVCGSKVSTVAESAA